VAERPVDRRPLWTAVLLLVLGALALWGSSGLTWVSEQRDRAGVGLVEVGRSGGEVVPALVPLAVLAVAAVAAAVALGGVARRVLGVLVALAGGLAVVLAVTAAGSLPPRLLAVAGGLAVLAGGVVLVLRSAVMPRLGGGYQTPGAAKRVADPERELWNALERGEDPTGNPPDAGPR
jgi:hypothetical protein